MDYLEFSTYKVVSGGFSDLFFALYTNDTSIKRFFFNESRYLLTFTSQIHDQQITLWSITIASEFTHDFMLLFSFSPLNFSLLGLLFRRQI